MNSKLLTILSIICLSFSFPSSLSLTESVDLFGEINSADLILNDIWIEPENPRDKEAVTVHASVYNAGIIPTGEVSDAVTVGYIVDGELVEIDLLGNILPGIENGIEITSGPLFDAVDGNHIITVIINYHDTLSHLRDNPKNNIVQKMFQIGTTLPSVITSKIYQLYNNETNQQQITIKGELATIFQDTLSNREIIIDINGVQQGKAITNSKGEFLFVTTKPFNEELIKATTHLENELIISPTQTVFPIKLGKEDAALALNIVTDDHKKYVEEQKLTLVVFQDTYENIFKNISTDELDKQSLFKDDFFVVSLPANHEYIMEVYLGGRLIDAFQYFIGNNEIIEKEILISESAEIKFNAIDRFGEPQNNVKIDNWIYSANTDETGFTDWIQILPTVSDNEPYVAKALFSDGSVVWSEPFQVSSGEKKIVTITKEGTR